MVAYRVLGAKKGKRKGAIAKRYDDDGEARGGQRLLVSPSAPGTGLDYYNSTTELPFRSTPNVCGPRCEFRPKICSAFPSTA